MEQIASDEILEQAFEWLCKRRKDYSHNNDIWDIRFRWAEIKPCLQKSLIAGEYSFSPQNELRMPGGNIELWSALDSLVLKAMSIVLGEHLKQPILSHNCYYLKGHGGAKAAVRATARHLKQGQHVMKSDVKDYYASIDHGVLYNQLEEYVKDRYVIRLLWQYMKRAVYCDGFYRDVKQGISLGCPLSPLMSALYLKILDDSMKKTGLFYARFMDDWVVIAPTRWMLREAVRVVNKTLNLLRVEKHPDKTFVGRVERGFDFLGYFLKPGILRVSVVTLKNCADRISRLYEQGADELRIGQYVKHFTKWANAGVSVNIVDSLRIYFPPSIKYHSCQTEAQ